MKRFSSHLVRVLRGDEDLRTVVLYWGIAGNCAWFLVVLIASLASAETRASIMSVAGMSIADYKLALGIFMWSSFLVYFPLSCVIVWRNSNKTTLKYKILARLTIIILISGHVAISSFAVPFAIGSIR